MPVSCFRLEDLLPQRPPMVLIDDVVSFDADARELTAAVTVKDAWHENWVAIEFMAQTAAALAGAVERAADPTAKPKMGVLLGTRKLTLGIPSFEVGRRYLVTARGEFSDGEAASFACEVTDGDTVVAKAILNAYRPQDPVAFLESQRS